MAEKLLHTDLLERRYGPVHIDLVLHTDEIRIVNIADAGGVCRTHAITWLTQIDYEDGTRFARAAFEIRVGQSLGKTFRSHGFSVDKRFICGGVVDIPSWLRKLFSDERTEGSFRIYEFVAVGDDGLKYSYGVVCEVDTPDFDSQSEFINADTTSQDDQADFYRMRMAQYLNR